MGVTAAGGKLRIDGVVLGSLGIENCVPEAAAMLVLGRAALELGPLLLPAVLFRRRFGHQRRTVR
jgi:hypothetical protein